MKILLVGASGTIGRAVQAELAQRHEVVRINRGSGDLRVDITDAASIRAMYAQAGAFDALVSTTGSVHFGPLAEFTAAEFDVGLRNKLMGQVNLVMLGLATIRDGGSFTLTSGLLNDDPIRLGASAAMVNGALDGFVRGAAIELPRGGAHQRREPDRDRGGIAFVRAVLPRCEAGAGGRCGAGLCQERRGRADRPHLPRGLVARPVSGQGGESARGGPGLLQVQPVAAASGAALRCSAGPARVSQGLEIAAIPAP